MPPDPLTTVRDRTQANLYWRHLGVEVEQAREGWVRLRVPISDSLRNALNAPVHGGVYASLVDMAVGGALATIHEGSEGGVGQATLDMNVGFVGGTSEGPIFAEGRILRRGRTIVFGETTITDATGRLLAVGRATYMIIRR
jgi:acyl-CoA thioesterase